MSELEYNKRQLDNLINKVNKRAETIKQRLGQESREYQNYVKTFRTAINGKGRIDTTSLFRTTDNGKKTMLSRSYSTWVKFADKYGADKVNEFIKSLDKLETYVEAEQRINKKYAELTKQQKGKSELIQKTPKQKAEFIRLNNEKITRYFQLLYSMANSTDNDESQEARALLYRSKSQKTESDKKEVLNLVSKYVENKKPKMDVEEIKEVEKWRYTKTQAINLAQRKAFDILWDEEPDMKKYNDLVDLVNYLKSVYSMQDISTKEITELVNEYVK